MFCVLPVCIGCNDKCTKMGAKSVRPAIQTRELGTSLIGEEKTAIIGGRSHRVHANSKDTLPYRQEESRELDITISSTTDNWAPIG